VLQWTPRSNSKSLRQMLRWSETLGRKCEACYEDAHHQLFVGLIWPYFVILLSTLLHFFAKFVPAPIWANFWALIQCVRVCVCASLFWHGNDTFSLHMSSYCTSTSKFL
jgi:hypothetical protein